jgi:hypothetical protein
MHKISQKPNETFGVIKTCLEIICTFVIFICKKKDAIKLLFIKYLKIQCVRSTGAVHILTHYGIIIICRVQCSYLTKILRAYGEIILWLTNNNAVWIIFMKIKAWECKFMSTGCLQNPWTLVLPTNNDDSTVSVCSLPSVLKAHRICLDMFQILDRIRFTNSF